VAISEDLKVYEVQEQSLSIARVMDFSKFSDLLKTKTLYFAPASKFDDELEGNYTHLDHQNTEERFVGWGFDDTALEIAADARKLDSTHKQQAVVISCWTIASEISLEMWDTYTSSKDSLAIQTTVEKLRDALGSDFLFIPVRYLDFNRDEIPRAHSLEPFFFKQESYSWEKELRIVAEMEAGKRIGSPRKAQVSPESFITGIKFHPKASTDFITNVKNLVKDKIPTANLISD